MEPTSTPSETDTPSEASEKAADAARDNKFTTMSGHPIRASYGPDDLTGDANEKIGEPGSYPFTRGPYESMYRGRNWTMRQFAGFGTVEETNERFHYLLEHGQTGLSTAFDMPTLMGYDSDHARSLGEVGREGVAVDTIDDMEILFRGIPLGEVSTSMTINAPAAILLAFYVLVGEKQGVPSEKLSGTIQTDILKEYIAQKEWCFPVEPALRLVTDMIEYSTEHMPRWHPVSVSGYHIREAGATAAQELAEGIALVGRQIDARSDGIGVSPVVDDQLAPTARAGDHADAGTRSAAEILPKPDTRQRCLVDVRHSSLCP